MNVLLRRAPLVLAAWTMAACGGYLLATGHLSSGLVLALGGACVAGLALWWE